MTVLTDLPAELLLLIFCQQVSRSALLALSSTKHTMRTLLKSNTPRILDNACAQTALLSTAKVHADTLSEICSQSQHPCPCDQDFLYDPWSIPELEHWSHDPSVRIFTSDAAARITNEVRPMRTINHVVSTALTAAGLAHEFWSAKADSCPGKHGFRYNADALAQAYLFSSQSAITHFSEAHRKHFVKVLSAVPSAFLHGVVALRDFLRYEIDMATQERLGMSDPDTPEDFKEVSATNQDNCIPTQWTDFVILLRDEVKNPYTKKRDPDEWDAALKKIMCDRPQGCTCPKEALMDWNEVPVEWWKMWKDSE